uniref:Uncharacterized protein n=1 Tax=Molossus molossus TaxID=27622 RepID=A0A7J8GRJ3_MOLMO|nr:hypothetical protein HJG59_011313 [Molossus molossus]
MGPRRVHDRWETEEQPQRAGEGSFHEATGQKRSQWRAVVFPKAPSRASTSTRNGKSKGVRKAKERSLPEPRPSKVRHMDLQPFASGGCRPSVDLPRPLPMSASGGNQRAEKERQGLFSMLIE